MFVEFEATGEFAEFNRWAMASFDDGTWTAYTDDIPDRFPVSAVTTFDGAVWLDPAATPSARGVVTFDGNTWTRHIDGQRVPITGGADIGTVWLAGPEPLLSAALNVDR